MEATRAECACSLILYTHLIEERKTRQNGEIAAKDDPRSDDETKKNV